MDGHTVIKIYWLQEKPTRLPWLTQNIELWFGLQADWVNNPEAAAPSPDDSWAEASVFFMDSDITILIISLWSDLLFPLLSSPVTNF